MTSILIVASTAVLATGLTQDSAARFGPFVRSTAIFKLVDSLGSPTGTVDLYQGVRSLAFDASLFHGEDLIVFEENRRFVWAVGDTSDIFAPAKGSNWHSTTDHLTQSNNVRDDAKKFLSSAPSDSEALHFVKNQKNTQLGQLTDSLKEIGFRQNISEAGGYNLHYDARQLAPVFGDYTLAAPQVVKGQYDHIFQNAGWLTRKLRDGNRSDWVQSRL
jgi:hypothetical protein